MKRNMQIIILAAFVACAMAIPGFAIEKNFPVFKSNEDLEMYRESVSVAEGFTTQEIDNASPLTLETPL